MTPAAGPPRSTVERDELIERFLPLVRYVVARLPVTMPATLDRDDFFAVGVMGLMHAANTYDAARGASFKTFAYTAIRGAILDEIRKHDPVPRSRRDRLRRLDRAIEQLRGDLDRSPTIDEVAEHLGETVAALDDDLQALHTCRILSLDETRPGSGGDEPGALIGSLACDASVDPGDDASTQEQIELLARAISELPETERHVVVLYHYEGLYLKEIGEILGVTESRISQILSRATARLQLKLKESP